jgi:hypothetical protein
MRTNKEEQAKIDNARVRNMLETLPKIRHQMAGYYDDLRKIEHEVYAFNTKFNEAIRAIYEIEQFYPGEEKTVEEKPESNIIPFPDHYTRQEESKTPEPRLGSEYKLSFAEHEKAFKGIGFEKFKFVGRRIIWGLYYLHIHSLAELAKTPVSTLLRGRNIGSKSLEIIHAVLESHGFTLGDDWGMIAGAKRHEG